MHHHLAGARAIRIYIRARGQSLYTFGCSIVDLSRRARIFLASKRFTARQSPVTTIRIACVKLNARVYVRLYIRTLTAVNKGRFYIYLNFCSRQLHL